jgi:hypothetical protein
MQLALIRLFVSFGLELPDIKHKHLLVSIHYLLRSCIAASCLSNVALAISLDLEALATASYIPSQRQSVGLWPTPLSIPCTASTKLCRNVAPARYPTYRLLYLCGFWRHHIANQREFTFSIPNLQVQLCLKAGRAHAPSVPHGVVRTCRHLR